VRAGFIAHDRIGITEMNWKADIPSPAVSAFIDASCRFSPYGH